MCELCEAKKEKVHCPSCETEGRKINSGYIERRLLYKPMIEGVYRECENKDCSVRFFSHNNAFFNEDVNE